MKFRFILIVGIFFFGKSVADELLSPYMNQDEFTDDASKVEATGVKVEIIEGESNNLKITHPVDLLVARQIYKEVEEND